jgi:predicted  nucleic acid-binding Zn-ribbon protein
MQNDQVAAFIELVELDQRLDRLTRQHEDEAAKKEILQHDLENIDREINQADKTIHEKQKKTHELELDLKTVERSLARTREKLLTARSQKELDSLEHEKRALELKREALDEHGLSLLDEWEYARAYGIALHDQSPELRKRMKKELELLQEQIDKIEIALGNCKIHRDKLKSLSHEELVSRYETMKQRIANPVVPVLKESCSGCFYPLSPAEIGTISKGQLGTCKSCYRLLYITKKEIDA